MKKAAALFLTLTMLLTMAGCSMTFINHSDGESAKDPKDPPAAADAQEPAVPENPEQGTEPTAPAMDAAGGDTESEYTIHVSHEDVTLKSAGETFRFTVWDSNGNDPSACTYTSADPAVAAVDEAGGEVTAVAPGTTTITAHVEFGGEKQNFNCIVRCQWTEEEEAALPASGTTAALPSLGDFFTTLQDKYEGLGAMMVMEGELLTNYYPGLSDIASVEEIYIQETMISVANVAVGLVKLSVDATAEDIAAVQSALQSRIDTQAGGGAWYPASCETWEQGVITSVSNVVGMFVYPDEAQAMADLFTETFGN